MIKSHVRTAEGQRKERLRIPVNTEGSLFWNTWYLGTCTESGPGQRVDPCRIVQRVRPTKNCNFIRQRASLKGYSVKMRREGPTPEATVDMYCVTPPATRLKVGPFGRVGVETSPYHNPRIPMYLVSETPGKMDSGLDVSLS